ncbi:sugar (pentulose or hexulose) kinase [Bradyrhizobium sp. LB9.1b]
MDLGIDIGTSGVKAVLVSEAGAVLATAARELALSHPAPLWSEQESRCLGRCGDRRGRRPCRPPSA